MNRVVHLKQNRERLLRIQEEAADWVARLDAGASEQDMLKLKSWFKTSPEHAEVLLQFARLWDKMSLLEELAPFVKTEELAANTVKSRRLPLLPLSAAAVVLMAVLGTLLVYGPFTQDPTLRESYTTATGMQLNVDLEDGSSMVLNTNTHLDIEFDRESRKIFLHGGEGLFKVASDKERPFQVYVGNRIVEATGTAFSVFSSSDETLEVLVSEGAVLVYDKALDAGQSAAPDSSGNAPPPLRVSLQAGQSFRYSFSNNQYQTVNISDDNMQAELSWLSGMLLFKQEPLEKVLREVSRYSSLTFEIQESLKALRVSAYVPVNDPEALLSSIESNFNVNVQYINETHVLLSPGETASN